MKFFLVVLSLLTCPLAFASTTLKSAEVVLQMLQNITSEDETLTPSQKLVSDIKSTELKVSSKSYAKQWLNWFDQFWKIDPAIRSQHYDSENDRGLNFSLLIKALPAPEVWPHFLSIVTARSESEEDTKKRYMLLMIAALLKGDLDEQINLSRNYTENLKIDERYTAYKITSYVDDILIKSSDKNSFYKYLDYKLDTANTDYGYAYFSLPNLIPLLGMNDTKVAIRRILQTDNVYIYTKSTELSNLIKDELISLGEKVQSAHWNFIDEISSNSISLYESPGFTKKPSDKDDAYVLATIYYLFSLAVQGKIDKAILTAKESNIKLSSIDASVYKKLIEAGYAKSVYPFIHHYMNESKDLDLLEPYIDISIAAHKHKDLVDFLEYWRSTPSNSDAINVNLDIYLTKAYFAIGNEKKGFKAFENLQVAYQNNKAAFATSQDALLYMSVDIMNAGIYSGNKKWYEIGKVFASKMNNNWLTNKNKIYYKFVNALIENNDLLEAQSTLLAHARFLATSSNFSMPSETPSYLFAVYAEADQCDDAMEFLDGYRGWGAIDTTNIMFQKVGSSSEFIGKYIAECLISQGKTEIAKDILELLMTYQAGYDPAYSLYLKLVTPDTAIAYFEQLHLYDAFEERPLIWKAVALNSQGKNKEAIDTLNNAIAIDPSDGEQHLGRRMLAYKLMGEIYDKINDKTKAQEFENIIDAIRVSENADKIFSAGFNQLSLDMYEEASNRFSGAYCIQSRLAVRQNAFGLTDKSMDHYRRAFELMPDSFGYMESHCLGCSAVFKNKTGQELADKVFQDLLISNKNKPQNFYMMGYLKKSQKDYTSAWAFFQKAVSLDQNYINAWKELDKIQAELIVNTRDYDEIILNLIRLDPMSRHIDISRHSVRNLENLWRATRTNSGLPSLKIKPTYPLNASAELIKKSLNELNPAQRKVFLEFYSTAPNVGRESPISPAEVLVEHKGFLALSSLVDTQR